MHPQGLTENKLQDWSNIMKVFNQTSDELYDRHNYRLIWKDGSHTDYDNYEIMKYMWYQYKHMAERVHVIDASQTGKGF